MQAGADLAALIAEAEPGLSDGDVVVVAQKVVSKAEGRVVALDSVKPSEEAMRLAEAHGKDARMVQVVLHESTAVIRASHGVIICQTRHGFVCANAGVDLSNSGGGDLAVLLPLDPDASARRLRATLSTEGVRIGVVISDSFGRPWRLGVTDVAIGAAGLVVLDDLRGQADADGHTLVATEVAVADQLAAAADLVRGKSTREPVVVVRGAERWVTAEDGPGAASIRRPAELDMFR